MELTESQLNFSYSQGFLEEWLRPAPAGVREHLETLVGAITFYKDRASLLEQDNTKLRNDYNNLAAQSAQYLQLIQQQKEMIDQHLIDGQRDLHKEEIEY